MAQHCWYFAIHEPSSAYISELYQCIFAIPDDPRILVRMKSIIFTSRLRTSHPEGDKGTARDTNDWPRRCVGADRLPFSCWHLSWDLVQVS
jgi:hypothetical protein